MNSTTTLAHDEPKMKLTKKAAGGRLFYSVAAALLLALTMLGFSPYYLHGKAFGGRDIAPPIHSLVLLHGIAMTGWILLFLIQPLLVASGNRRVHMTLGRLGAALALCMVVMGLWVGIKSASLTPPQVRIWGITPKQFMLIPVGSIIIFGLFVAAGIYYRRRPDIHRPMMLMATLIVVPAGISRIAPLSALYQNTSLRSIFGPFFWTLVLATLFLLLKWAMTRSFDRKFAIAYGCLVASYLLVWQLATTSAWERVATLLL